MMPKTSKTLTAMLFISDKDWDSPIGCENEIGCVFNPVSRTIGVWEPKNKKSCRIYQEICHFSKTTRWKKSMFHQVREWLESQTLSLASCRALLNSYTFSQWLYCTYKHPHITRSGGTICESIEQCFRIEWVVSTQALPGYWGLLVRRFRFN